MTVFASSRAPWALALVLLLACAGAPRAVAETPAVPRTSPLPTFSGSLTYVAREAGRLAPRVGTVATRTLHTVRPLAGTTLQAVALAETIPRTVRTVRAAPAAFSADPAAATWNTAGKLVQNQVGLSDKDVGRMRTVVQQSPAYERVRSPFDPGNIMLAVGVTAGANLVGHLARGEDEPLSRSFEFLGQGSFWGGLAGSGVGYSLASMVAMHLVPAGPALLPTVAPMMAGLAGSQLGWDLGAGALDGRSPLEVLRSTSLGKVAGQSAGQTMGMLAGANLATLIGGSLGSVAGPVGAVAGAVLVGQVGARLGEQLERRLRGEEDDLEGVLAETHDGLRTVRDGQQTLELLLPALTLAKVEGDAPGAPSSLDSRHRELYRALEAALTEGRREDAAACLAALGEAAPATTR